MPLIAYRPGTIPPGTTQYDLMPTLAEAGGKPVTAEMNGISILPTLCNEPQKQAKREYLYWEFYEVMPQQAVHLAKWKGYRARGLKGKGERYDLSTDIGEKDDVAEKHPKIVARTEKIMQTEHSPLPTWKLPGIDTPLP